MRLKSIDIAGFKSFVDKTRLTFDPSICAIVGPNGCGKSNVVDAIKWAMGEQSAKQLRGRSMEDVIFVGSEGRKPVGMAQVTLTFSNDDGAAPPPYSSYSEIAVTRRLYRSGESEYLINKTPVRLRDIVELFMDTGVGKRAYSIIEQDQVNRILNSKPEERRVLLEEAAGITKYKARKEEALRKVRQTQQDLVRVTDTILEIRRSLNSLNRQAKKAERYKAYKGELRAIDLVLGSLRYQEYQRELERLEAAIAATRERRDVARTTLAEVEADRERFQIEALEKEKEVASWQEQVHRLDAGVRDLESRIAVLDRDRENTTLRRERYAADIQTYRARLETSGRERAEAEAEAAEYERRADVEEADLSEKAEALADRKARHQELAGRIETEKGALIDVLTEIATTRKTLDALADRKEEIGFRRTEAGEKADALEARVQTLSTDLARMRDAFVASQSAYEELSASREERGRKLAQLRDETEVKRRRYDELRDDLGARKARLAGLRELVDGLEGFGKGTKSLLLADDRRPPLPGIHGPMADYLEIEPRYETALAAVLGDRLQTIMVEATPDGVGAIQFLKSESEGRGSFLPVTEHRSVDPGFPSESLQMAIGSMNELVQCPEPYAPVVRNMLADVLVVEDLEKAVEIHNRNGYSGAVVTLDGEVLHSGGLMTGGTRESADATILQRRREVRELDEKVQELSVRFAAAEDAYLKSQGLVGSVERKIAELDEALREKERDLVNREGSITRVETEIESASGEVSRLREEETRLAAEEQVRVEKETEASRRIGELDAAKSERSETVSGLERRAAALAAELEEIGQLVTESRIGITTFRQKAAGLRQAIVQMERAAVELESLIAQRTEEIAQAESDETRIAGEIAGLRERIGERIGERGGLETSLEAARAAYDAVVEKTKDAERRAKELRAEIEELQQADHRDELSLQEVRMKRDHLTDEIRERYRLELAEVLPLALEGVIPIDTVPEPVRSDDDEDEDEAPEVIFDPRHRMGAAAVAEAEPTAEAASEEGEDVEAAGESEETGDADESIAVTTESLPDELDPMHPAFAPEAARERQTFLRQKIEAMGEVNPNAIEEYAEQNERYDFYTQQKEDLEESILKLKSAIQRINQTSRKRFTDTFNAVNEKFQQLVPLLFVGGRGELRLVGEEQDVLEQGVDIVMRPVGKKLQSMTLMSGGEKALSAIALIFAIFLHKPSPFTLLDEVDAPLDDQNVHRYTALLREMSQRSQFIVITHNKNTMEAAGMLYGVTMEEPGVSKIVSVRFEEALEAV